MKYIVAALVAAVLTFGGIQATAGQAPQGRMPNLSALHELEEMSATDPCDIGKDMVVRHYNTPGLEEAPLFKANAVFIVGERRPFIVSWAQDETDASSWPDQGLLYYDYDRDGISDDVTPRGETRFLELVCEAAKKLKYPI